MPKIRDTVKITFMTLATMLIAGYCPVTVSADDASTSGTAATASSPTTTTTSTPAPSTATTTDSSPAPVSAPDNKTTTNQGPTNPPGADGKTYHYNAATGMWENDYYIWNPTTGQTTPKQPPTYSYNPATGKWDTTQWRYDATSGKYVPNVVSVSQPPAGAITLNAPSAQTPSPQVSTPSAPSSTPKTSTSVSTDDTYDNFYNASISNNLNSTATSGDADVTHNTSAGDATSGNAQAIATVINLLQSSGNIFGKDGNLITFVSNINGDVNGDLLIDPTKLNKIQPAASSDPLATNLKVNAQNNTQINNNLSIAASSGNAAVATNTSAGNATTGNASAIANLVNVIDSVITSGKSFMGMVNINGNLNGDILLPPDFINQLIASNAPVATVNTSQIEKSQTLTDITNNQAITNNVSATATSGQANVSNNTSAGNATTGSANTNLTLFNLTGSNVIGSNDLIVFVNVLGKWVGMIVNSPAGTTAAELGSGITSQKALATENTNLSSTNNAQINNNITVAATSGDASVTSNTEAGDATSGNANASVNLLNVINGTMSLSDWFGILFINVFGTWNGSFGVNTSAGNQSITPAAPVNNQPASKIQVFRFVPTSAGNTKKANITPATFTSGDNFTPINTADLASSSSVLAAQITKDPTSTSHKANPTVTPVQHNYLWSIAGITLAVALLLGERVHAFHRSRSA